MTASWLPLSNKSSVTGRDDRIELSCLPFSFPWLVNWISSYNMTAQDEGCEVSCCDRNTISQFNDSSGKSLRDCKGSRDCRDSFSDSTWCCDPNFIQSFFFQSCHFVLRMRVRDSVSSGEDTVPCLGYSNCRLCPVFVQLFPVHVVLCNHPILRSRIFPCDDRRIDRRNYDFNVGRRTRDW